MKDVMRKGKGKEMANKEEKGKIPEMKECKGRKCERRKEKANNEGMEGGQVEYYVKERRKG